MSKELSHIAAGCHLAVLLQPLKLSVSGYVTVYAILTHVIAPLFKLKQEWASYVVFPHYNMTVVM
jgi:hypothetical protein